MPLSSPVRLGVNDVCSHHLLHSSTFEPLQEHHEDMSLYSVEKETALYLTVLYLTHDHVYIEHHGALICSASGGKAV